MNSVYRTVAQFEAALNELQPEYFEFGGELGEVGSTGAALKQARLTTAMRVDKNTPSRLQSALGQSQTLRPFIGNKLTTKPITKNFVLHGWDETFNGAYFRLHNLRPQRPNDKPPDTVRGFYHQPTDAIHVRPSTTIGQALQLAIQKIATHAFRTVFGDAVDQGLSLYFANRVLAEQGLDQMAPEQYVKQSSCARLLIKVAGLSMVGRAYFENPTQLFNHLTGKLSIGPVNRTEITNNALCNTALLAAANLGSQQVQRMIAVGMTGPRSVRLWMRSDVAGPHQLEISGGSRGPTKVNITIPAGQPGDKTKAITYPGLPQDPPLQPKTRYRYRVVRTSDGTPLGEGSFETAPNGDADTPNKVVIGVTSCNQPFDDDGSINTSAARMLRLVPRILQENNVKFVLACGDQMYADDPGNLSLLRNPFLLRMAVGKSDIRQCSDEEIRRAYDLRYRMFWSMPPVRKMYANYPCYPAMDDHEIMNAWGSLPEHTKVENRTIALGARRAYLDYQASPFLSSPKLPRSFHYQFSYGNIGVFVMDIRSERVLDSRPQVFSVAQLDDLRQFLRNNGDKKVLLIVASVPVVFVPGGLAKIGAKFKPSTFLDHWSHPKTVQARDALLSLLHQHQQAHPKQRMAIVSGDVHIGNAIVVNWRGGNKPRLYQFTSSALTARETRLDYFLIKTGQSFDTDINCQSTSGQGCSGRVSHLRGVNEASSNNPYIGLNMGLIEIYRAGDVSNLKFKLIGTHPTEDRPVTYFESGVLG